MPAALLVLALLGGWELLVRLGGVDPLILPAPSQIAESLWTDSSLLANDLLVTLYEVLLGLAAAIAIGIALAIAMHLWLPVRRTLHPLVVGSQAIPILIVAPLLILILGFGLLPKILIIALVCFFPITINLYDGLRSADPEARKLMRTLSATRWQIFKLLEMRSAIPQAFTGLRIAAAVAVIGAVFAEWSGSENGLGHTLFISSGELDTARAFAATFLLFVLAIALYGLFAFAERRLVTWTRRTEPDRPKGLGKTDAQSN